MNPQQEDAKRGCLMALALPFITVIMFVIKVLNFLGINKKEE